MSALDPRLEQRLRALAPPAPGDWQDVTARARQLEQGRAGRRRRLVVALAALALLLVAGAALAIGNQLFGWFTVSTSDEEAPTLPAAAPYVASRTLYQAGEEPQQLSRPLLASLLGQDAPLVVSSPDGRYLVYHAWSRGVPLLVLHDRRLGGDRILARGAQTVAWGADGRIAYVQADPPRYRSGHAYRGRVVVQSLGGAPVAWTERPSSYEVLAWAGSRLLVAVDRCLLPECRDDPGPGVYVLARAGLLRLSLAGLTALSPDGRLAVGPYRPFPGGDDPTALVRLVDTRSGRVLTTLDLTRAAAAADMRGLLPGTLGTGTWRSDELVATFSGRDSALVSFRVRDRRLTFESVVRIPDSTLPASYGVSFGRPVFVGKGTRRVVVAVHAEAKDGRPLAAVLACDRRTRRCVRGQMLPARRWFAVVENPSRPFPGG